MLTVVPYFPAFASKRAGLCCLSGHHSSGVLCPGGSGGGALPCAVSRRLYSHLGGREELVEVSKEMRASALRRGHGNPQHSEAASF